MPRLAKSRGIKVHWNYSVAEVARTLGVTRNTVRRWIKDGLPVISDRKPYLILGRELKAFLSARNAARKRPLAPGEFYCLACHAPRRPAGGMADYVATSKTGGTLQALCETCESIVKRHVSLDDLKAAGKGLDLGETDPSIAIRQSASVARASHCRGVRQELDQDTLSNVTNPPLNRDLEGPKKLW